MDMTGDIYRLGGEGNEGVREIFQKNDWSSSFEQFP